MADGQASRPGGRSSGRRAAAAAASKHRDRAGGRSANSAGRQLRRVRGQGAAAGPAQGNALRRAGAWGRGSYVYIRLYLVYIIDQICTDISVYICSYTCI